MPCELELHRIVVIMEGNPQTTVLLVLIEVPMALDHVLEPALYFWHNGKVGSIPLDAGLPNDQIRPDFFTVGTNFHWNLFV